MKEAENTYSKKIGAFKIKLYLDQSNLWHIVAIGIEKRQHLGTYKKSEFEHAKKHYDGIKSIKE